MAAADNSKLFRKANSAQPSPLQPSTHFPTGAPVNVGILAEVGHPFQIVRSTALVVQGLQILPTASRFA